MIKLQLRKKIKCNHLIHPTLETLPTQDSFEIGLKRTPPRPLLRLLGGHDMWDSPAINHKPTMTGDGLYLGLSQLMICNVIFH